MNGQGLLRNACLNFLSQAWLWLLALASAPILIQRMGTDGYGVLAVIMIVTGYLTLLDLGISRGMIKFLSATLARGEWARIPSLITTGLLSQCILGVLGTIALWGIIPVLLQHFFRIPSTMTAQARFSLEVVAIAFPIFLLVPLFEGILMTFQRFDIISGIRVLSGTLKAGLTIALVMAGLGIRGAVLSLVSVQALHLGLILMFVPRLIRGRPEDFRWNATEFRNLLTFGGWVMISGLVGPILVYLDRFLVAIFLSIRAVTYYSISYEAITKLWIIPFAIMPVLFPAFAALQAQPGERRFLSELYLRSLKYTLVILAPVVTLAVVYAPQFLHLWLGQEIAANGSRAMQILAFGVLVNSLAHAPYAMVQAAGRPDLIAKFYLAEIPIYLALCFWLIPNFGVSGAAATWTVRVTLDAVLLTISAARLTGIAVGAMFSQAFGPGAVPIAFLAAGTIMIKKLGGESMLDLLLLALVVNFYIIGVWRFAMTPAEREPLTSILTRLWPASARAA